MKARAAFFVVIALLLSACQFSLAGDVTPPPGSDLSAATLTPADIEFPAEEPDLASGAAIFAESCAPCHGASGLGDGVQADQLPVSPPPIGTHELVASASPAGWYQVVTQGNLDNFMPPFANRLNLQQRWDVLAFTYSLSRDTEALERGASLYNEKKSQLVSLFPHPSELESTARLSQNEIAESLLTALTDLSQDDAKSLASYLQSLSLGGGTAPESGELPNGEEATNIGSIYGNVVNGTSGVLPSGLEATLYAYDGQEQVSTTTVAIDANGNYQFQDVPQAPERTFFVSVDYEGLSYFSEFLTVETDIIRFDQPITIYETTSNASQLAIEKLTLVFEFEQPSVVRVVEQVIVSNIGDRAVTPAEDGAPALRFSLPAEASNLVFDEGTLGDRYVALESGFGDLRAVLPGTQSYQLLFAYDLPYSRGVSFPLSVDLPTRSVLLFVPAGNITVAGLDFLDGGTQDLQGSLYQAYISNGAYSAGHEIEVRLRGAHPLGGLQSLAADNRLLAGLAALTISVGLAWLWLHSLQPNVDLLMDQIIALDERHKRGDIAKNAYNQKRAALKEKLRRALKEK